MLKYPKKKKKVSRQKEYTKWVTKTLKYWSMVVRENDGYICKWCGSVKNTQAHHIVARGITQGCRNAWFDYNNGMTLCFNCHIHKLKSLPDEYIKVRDDYLNSKGLNYKTLRLKYSVISKLPLDELKILHDIIKKEAETL